MFSSAPSSFSFIQHTYNFYYSWLKGTPPLFMVIKYLIEVKYFTEFFFFFERQMFWKLWLAFLMSKRYTCQHTWPILCNVLCSSYCEPWCVYGELMMGTWESCWYCLMLRSQGNITYLENWKAYFWSILNYYILKKLELLLQIQH